MINVYSLEYFQTYKKKISFFRAKSLFKTKYAGNNKKHRNHRNIGGKSLQSCSNDVPAMRKIFRKTNNIGCITLTSNVFGVVPHDGGEENLAILRVVGSNLGPLPLQLQVVVD